MRLETEITLACNQPTKISTASPGGPHCYSCVHVRDRVRWACHCCFVLGKKVEREGLKRRQSLQKTLEFESNNYELRLYTL